MTLAFKGVGSASTANSLTANQASLVLTTATTAGAIGDLAVLMYAVDNNQTTDGDEGAVTAVSDSAGNVWLKAKEFTNGQALAQAGATVGMWYSNLKVALAIGATVTMTFSNATSRDASAASLAYFTKAANTNVGIEGIPTTLASDAVLAGSLNCTLNAFITCLRIRAIASEATVTTALTPTSFWAVLQQAVASSGTAATSMGIRAEYIINATDTQNSQPTAGAGAVDGASIYVAFKELVAILPFQNRTMFRKRRRK